MRARHHNDERAPTMVYLDNVYIRSEAIEPCLLAVQRLNSRMPQMLRDPNRYRSVMRLLPNWSSAHATQGVLTDDETDLASLVQALAAWRYEAHICDDGRIQLNRFTGVHWGCDEMLFHAMAPYIQKDGKVHCLAGTEYWTYLFVDASMVIITGEEAIACQHGGHRMSSMARM